MPFVIDFSVNSDFKFAYFKRRIMQYPGICIYWLYPPIEVALRAVCGKTIFTTWTGGKAFAACMCEDDNQSISSNTTHKNSTRSHFHHTHALTYLLVAQPQVVTHGIPPVVEVTTKQPMCEMMDASQSQPLFYSPAFPSELLWYIIHRCSYPTTLIVCSSRLEFLAALAREIKQGQQAEEEQEPQGQQQEQQQGQQQQSSPQVSDRGMSFTDTEQQHPPPQTQQASQPRNNHPNDTSKITPGPNPWSSSQLLASPLYQLAVARHIRTVFIPTVSHLRAFLSVFDPSSTNSTTNSSSGTNKVPAPPAPPPYASGSGPDQPPGSSNHGGHQTQRRIIIVYGFLALHRDSSEWSVQGLNNSVAVLLEAGRRVGLGVVVVEPVGHHHDCHDDDEKKSMMESLLGEKMPVVSGSALKGAGAGDLERSVGIVGKTVDVRRMLGRWFRFGVGEWER